MCHWVMEKLRSTTNPHPPQQAMCDGARCRRGRGHTFASIAFSSPDISIRSNASFAKRLFSCETDGCVMCQKGARPVKWAGGKWGCMCGWREGRGLYACDGSTMHNSGRHSSAFCSRPDRDVWYGSAPPVYRAAGTESLRPADRHVLSWIRWICFQRSGCCPGGSWQLEVGVGEGLRHLRSCWGGGGGGGAWPISCVTMMRYLPRGMTGPWAGTKGRCWGIRTNTPQVAQAAQVGAF